MAGAPPEAAVEEWNADHKIVLRAGEGPMPNEGATVRGAYHTPSYSLRGCCIAVHVKGWLCDADLVITNTHDKDEPAQFLLGQGTSVVHRCAGASLTAVWGIQDKCWPGLTKQ